jgi:hypothetical protein
MHHGRNGRQHRRRRRIVREGFAADDPAILDESRIGSPMGERWKAGDSHDVYLVSSFCYPRRLSATAHRRCRAELVEDRIVDDPAIRRIRHHRIDAMTIAQPGQIEIQPTYGLA